MASDVAPADRIAVVPLVGNQETDEGYALGALLSALLADHLLSAGLPTIPARAVVRQILESKLELPLDAQGIQTLKAPFGLRAVVHGRYVLDNGGKMLGLHLVVDAPHVPPAPLEASTPFAGFSRFLERMALALVERLGLPIDDALRQRVNRVNRPASFEAFQQVAQAQAAWIRGQNELALAAISSALALDPDYEEAVAIEVAVARVVGDTATVRDAFQRWAAIAVKRGRLADGAERLMLLGHWLNERGEWVEARAAYEDARNLYRRRNDEVGEARALNNQANLDLVADKVQAAIRTYRRSLRVFEADPKAQADTAFTLLNLALAHKNLGQHEEALTAVDRAVMLARTLRDMRLEARCLAQRGTIRDDMGEWAAAQTDYARAAQLFDVAGDTIGLAMVRSHQAILLKQQGYYARAETLMLQALEVFERRSALYDRAILWLNLADLYFSMGAYDQAWHQAEQARDVFARQKSGWLEQVEALIKALEAVRRKEEFEQDEEELVPPVAGQEALDNAVTSSEAASPGEGLYNEGELYHNDHDDKASDGGDGDLNSGVGRTPTL